MQTKIDVVNDSYSQMRISGLTVQASPEDIELAVIRLESMMHEIFFRNINVGYNFEESPDPNSLTNVEPYAWQMMSTNLAVRLIPDFNKAVPPTLIAKADASLSTVSSITARNYIQEVQYPRRHARGSGNTLRYNRWQRYYRNPAFAPSEAATNILSPGDVNDYVERYDQYLNDLETITSFSITADNDLTISNATFTDTEVSYRVTVEDNPEGTTTGFQRVVIQITTSDGRITSRQINFEIRL